MPPKCKRATRAERSQGPANGVKKNRKPTTRKNTQSRQAYSLTAPTAISITNQASLKPSVPSQELDGDPRTRAQKRKRTYEDHHSQKRPRTDPPSAPAPATISQELAGISQTREDKQGKKRPREDPQSSSIPAAASQDLASAPKSRGNTRPHAGNQRLNKQRQQSETESCLSEENLRKLQSELQPERMKPAATPANRVRKRDAISQQSQLSDLNPETATVSVHTHRSAASLKFYRYHILERARVYIRCEYPPPGIQVLLDVIFTREVLKERKLEISRVAKETAQKFSSKTRGAHREDDLIEALNGAFDDMFPKERFNCPRKADWNPDLKPNILQDDVWNLDALDQASSKTDGVVERPAKRQQADQSFPSPTTSQSTSQPLAALSQPKQDGAVKSPRPDLTIGHQHSTMANALMKLGLSKRKADELLIVLQREGKLFSDPTIDYLNVRFPIQVVEGKAYATGKTNFEAEDQAVISGVCMVNLQQQLIDLYERIFPNAEKSKTPFAFSVCMEGPVIQYWVNYSLTEEDTRMYYMNLLCICNGALYDTLEVLLVKWEQLMGWYENVFLVDIAKKLYRIAEHIAR